MGDILISVRARETRGVPLGTRIASWETVTVLVREEVRDHFGMHSFKRQARTAAKETGSSFPIPLKASALSLSPGSLRHSEAAPGGPSAGENRRACPRAQSLRLPCPRSPGFSKAWPRGWDPNPETRRQLQTQLRVNPQSRWLPSLALIRELDNGERHLNHRFLLALKSWVSLNATLCFIFNSAKIRSPGIECLPRERQAIAERAQRRLREPGPHPLSRPRSRVAGIPTERQRPRGRGAVATARGMRERHCRSWH